MIFDGSVDTERNFMRSQGSADQLTQKMARISRHTQSDTISKLLQDPAIGPTATTRVKRFGAAATWDKYVLNEDDDSELRGSHSYLLNYHINLEKNDPTKKGSIILSV